MCFVLKVCRQAVFRCVDDTININNGDCGDEDDKGLTLMTASTLSPSAMASSSLFNTTAPQPSPRPYPSASAENGLDRPSCASMPVFRHGISSAGKGRRAEGSERGRLYFSRGFLGTSFTRPGELNRPGSISVIVIMFSGTVRPGTQKKTIAIER